MYAYLREMTTQNIQACWKNVKALNHQSQKADDSQMVSLSNRLL